ncbi:MAG: transcription termination/antitermination protein NusA [Chloroflexi bacterium]|nr:transcription termination/antitermination protein NusA [Chloroflexota bacterium]
MKSEFEIAITQLSADRNLSPQVILEAIEAALVSAYKRNYGSSQNARVSIDPRTGQARVYVKKMVVQEVTDDNTQISLAEARSYEPKAAIGDFIDIEVKPRNFGRIAAQTAKQVITQRIREAERDSVYAEYAERVGEVVNGIVRNVDARTNDVVLSLGKAEVLLPHNEQIPHEHYRFNQRLRVYIVGVEKAGHGPQIKVSRSHPELLRRLMELEVPEIYNGIVEIKAIAREPGFRSKVAVAALQPGVDPVGSCVGMRGVRIRNIVNELNGEKIDVVCWSSDMRTFIANALSPAKVVSVYLNEADKTATVIVPDRSLSLAIGKEGQNARLAAKLTGWRIDIKSETEAAEEAERLAAEREEAERRAREREEARRAAAELLAQAEAALAAEDEMITEGEAEPLTMAQEVELVQEGAGGAVPEVGPEEVVVGKDFVASEDAAEQVEAAVGEAAEAEAVEAAEAQEPSGERAVESVEVEAMADVEAEPETTDVTDEAEEMGVDYRDASTDEWIEDDLFEEEGERRSRKKRRRDRRLEYDEQLGRVVSRKRRKPGRRSWEDSWYEDDD